MTTRRPRVIIAPSATSFQTARSLEHLGVNPMARSWTDGGLIDWGG
jgi:hypothetical protein